MGLFDKFIKKEEPVQPVSTSFAFNVSGVSYRMDNVIKLATPMKKWDMTNEQLMQKYPRKKIYRYFFITEPVQLVPEPTNPHDPNAIMVLINNIHVGYVPKEYCDRVKKMPVTASLSAKISGGEYKIVDSVGQAASFSDSVQIIITIK